MLRVRISIRAICPKLCDKISQRLATGRWFSPGPPVSSNKTDHHNITEILLKVALNTIKPTNKPKIPQQMTLEIHVLAWDRDKTVESVSRLWDPNPPLLIAGSPTAMHI